MSEAVQRSTSDYLVTQLATREVSVTAIPMP